MNFLKQKSESNYTSSVAGQEKAGAERVYTSSTCIGPRPLMVVNFFITQIAIVSHVDESAEQQNVVVFVNLGYVSQNT